MKKFPIILGAAALVFLSACSSKDTNVVNVYNWESYLPEDVQAEFTQVTGIRLNYEEYDSNETMLAKLRTGANYDICFPSAEFIPPMIEDGMLEELDYSKLPNIASIDREFMDRAATFDPGNRYTVPYCVGTVGIVYWKDKIPSPDPSYTILGDPQYKGKIAILDDVREVFGAALASLGFSPNSVNPAEIDQATDLILRWKANALKFDNTQMASLFASKEVWLALNFPENILTELDPELAQDAGFFIPREGALAYMDNMVILKNGKNKDNAYAFINFILQPEILARIYDTYGFPGISSAARELQEGTPYYSSEELKPHDIKMPLYDKNHLYTTPWEEKIKIGN